MKFLLAVALVLSSWCSLYIDFAKPCGNVHVVAGEHKDALRNDVPVANQHAVTNQHKKVKYAHSARCRQGKRENRAVRNGY